MLKENPIGVDVFFPLPEGWGLCLTCESMLARAGLNDRPGTVPLSPAERGLYRQGLDEYPREYRVEVDRLIEYVFALSSCFGERVVIRIHDPRSLRAMAKALRHGVRHYPAFVVAGQGCVTGWQREALEERVERAVRAGPPPETRFDRLIALLRQFILALRQILYGMTVYEMTRDLRKERGHLERIFILVTFGDLLGVPVLPPYYTMRLLPFVVPHINAWRRSLLRERDLTDLCDQEIT